MKRYQRIFSESYRDETDEIFVREREDGNYDILYVTDGLLFQD